MSGAVARWPDDGIILFDGVCVLCSAWVRFVAERDVERRFHFTPIQSPYGRKLAESLGIDPDEPDTNAAVIDGMAFRRSEAALAILSKLPGWKWVAVFRALPQGLRDAIYGFVARNRYRLFGRRDFCSINGKDFTGRLILNLPADHAGNR
jgi:predicted DCC family thiol-disulfide oxidoreductase YuxK